MIKTKCRITITADLEYFGVAFDEKMEEAFKSWILEFSTDNKFPLPIIYEDTADGEITVGHHPDAKMEVIIEKDNKIILGKEWDEIGNPYGD